MGELGQDAEVTPPLIPKDFLGFLMTTESQDLGLTSHPKDGAFLQYSVPVNIQGRLDPHSLTNLFQQQPSFSEEVSH